MSPKLKAYVALTTLTGTLILWNVLPQDIAARWGHYAAWVGICLLAESLWLTTLSGSGTVSMASAAGLAAAVLWGRGPCIWIVAASTLLADIFIARKVWVRAVFNTSQISITMWLAASAFALLGGPQGGIESGEFTATGASAAIRLLAPILGLFLVYLVVNRLLVSIAISWSSERPYLKVLRQDFFYAERLLQDAAAFLLAPLMAISFRAIGYPGVVLFYAPLYIFNESTRRYLELMKAQNQIIHSERMAAKGEMAAEVGHELRNQLVAISGRAQMLVKDSERGVTTNVARHAQIILEQTHRMEALSKGLMDFSHGQLSIERIDLNGLIQRSIEFVRTQNRFDGVDWDVRLVEPSPELRADPGQLQQVLLNLFINAADAMNEKSNGRKVIAVVSELDERRESLRLVVSDSGTGIPGSNLSKIFEPHFTTKPTGHGFGLSTSYRIITNHGGKIVAESPPGQGAQFTILLPTGGPKGWG